MTLIVRDSEGTIHVLSKGAEISMLPVCIKGPIDATRSIVDKFAEEGLRTLVLAHKIISEQELAVFTADLEKAKQSLASR